MMKIIILNIYIKYLSCTLIPRLFALQINLKRFKCLNMRKKLHIIRVGFNTVYNVLRK